MDALLQAMKAAGEPTRLGSCWSSIAPRLTVSEICRILGQRPTPDQPPPEAALRRRPARPSRRGHPRVLPPRPEPYARQFLAALRPLVQLDASVLVADQEELARVRADRAELAARSLAKTEQESALLEGRKVAASVVEEAMLDAVGSSRIDGLLDIGPGRRVLELFAPWIRSGLGIELSREMLNLARTRLDAAGLDHCTVRSGNAYSLEIEPGLDRSRRAPPRPALPRRAGQGDRAGSPVARARRPAPRRRFRRPQARGAPDQPRSRRLGFTDGEVTEWCTTAGLTMTSTDHLTPPVLDDVADDDLLTVSIWVARRRRRGPTNVIDFRPPTPAPR